jgi:uncharacterized protein (DUF58 family)
VRDALSNLTTRGRAFLSAGITSSVCALVLGQKDLLRVGLLLMALPAITAWVANRSRYLLSSSRSVVPPRVEVGQTAQVTVQVDNPGRLPTGLMLLEDSVPYVLGGRPRFVLDQLRPKWTRSMTYAVRSDVRGRYEIGPLTVRVSDPFGFVEVDRAFTNRATLVVTPAITQLPAIRLSGDWSGAGESRPRAFASAGTEDVMVREYRLGDDLRRIHWPSTARADELMVRREEQPHQSRATLVLDTRAMAHRGTGPASSFEFAVAAAASIGAHLAAHQFTVRLISEANESADVSWHDRGISGPAEVRLLLDTLAVVQTRPATEFAGRNEQHSSGLVVALLGAVNATDVVALSRLRAGATRALAVLLDVAAWSSPDASSRRVPGSAVEDQADVLRREGWAVVVAGPGDRLPALWHALGTSSTGGRRHDSDGVLTSDGPAA